MTFHVGQNLQYVEIFNGSFIATEISELFTSFFFSEVVGKENILTLFTYTLKGMDTLLCSKISWNMVFLSV